MKIYKKLLKNIDEARFSMLISCFCAAIMVSLVRLLSYDFNVFSIIFMRNICAIILFIPYILKSKKNFLFTNKIGLHIFRGGNGLLSMILWFYAIINIPLSEAVSISFTIPIITTFAAVIFLKEKIESKFYLSLLCGLIGVLIILRPGFRDLNLAHFACLGAVFLWTISNLIIKNMTKTESPQTITLYMSLIMTILSLPLVLINESQFFKLNFANLSLFILLGLFSNLTHVFLSKAYSKSDLSRVQPVDFSRLIFTTIFAYSLFGEKIGGWTILGALIILLSVFIANKRPYIDCEND